MKLIFRFEPSLKETAITAFIKLMGFLGIKRMFDNYTKKTAQKKILAAEKKALADARKKLEDLNIDVDRTCKIMALTNKDYNKTPLEVLEDNVNHKLLIEKQLRKSAQSSMLNKRIPMFYQPDIIDFHNERVEGVEKKDELSLEKLKLKIRDDDKLELKNQTVRLNVLENNTTIAPTNNFL